MNLQEEVRKLSEARARSGLFKVDILYWEDVCNDLQKNFDIFFQHYPQFKSGPDPVIEHDRRLYDELMALLPSDGAIGFVDRHNMAGWIFRDTELGPLTEFQERWSKPERYFITTELEKSRQALWTKVNVYLGVISTQTFPSETGGCRSVPSDWEEEDPTRFKNAVDTLHTLAGDLVALHTDFVRVGRMHLIGVRK